MRARKEVRRKAEIEKAEVMKQFEKMKLKGKMDLGMLAKLGLDDVAVSAEGTSNSSSPKKRAHSSYEQVGRGSKMSSARKSYPSRENVGRQSRANQIQTTGQDFTPEVQFLKKKKMSAVQAKKQVDELRLRYNK